VTVTRDDAGAPLLHDTRTKTAERHEVTLDTGTVRIWREFQAERQEFGPCARVSIGSPR